MSPRNIVLVIALVAAPVAAQACSICNPDLQNAATFRQDLRHARLILHGTVANPRLVGTTGAGVSDFHIRAVLKADPWLGKRTVVEVPRYVPVTDPKSPPQYLLFCDVAGGRLDILRGPPVQSDEAARYVKGLLALEGKPATDVLRYCFDFLEHADKELAQDAFLEFAKASDRDLGQVAPKLPAEKLRGWLKSPRTPDHRLGLYAFLLGCCGTEKDAAFLRALLQGTDERTQTAFDGLLAGYIQLRPRDGWELARAILADERRPFPVRFAVLRTLRLYHSWKPEESKARVLDGLRVVLGQSDMADMAVEDLRRWQVWDLTDDVLRLAGKKGYDAPLMRQALVRYALACPRDEAKRWVAALRRQDPALVRDVEESLQFEKK